MDWTRGRSIGHGSSATVSLATSRHSGEIFAVKSVGFSQSESLQREQRILSSLWSPYIVGYKGSDVTVEHNKVMYNLFMEYVPGGTLTGAIRRNGGRLDESMIVHYTRQILQGLEYLHSNGLVHCDIKGSNILIGQSGAKISDFGCAKEVNRVESDAGPIGGTPAFMAPEVARGEQQGHPSDIWALGCTFIEMASGSAGWRNVSDPVSVLYRIAYSDELPEFPCVLSEQAKDFLGKCLNRDPKQRWTATQLLKHPFLAEFKQIEEHNSISTSPTSILDQGFWNSVEESQNLVHASSETSPGERIRRLASFSGESSWDSDEKYITVRENESIMGEIEGKDEMICGSEREEDLISDNVEKQESNVESRGWECRKESILISSLELERDTDMLLLSSTILES